MKASPAQPSCDAIDALLPQTQCRQCGYGGCLPYAEAIRAGQADINQCPPGGEEVIRDLAALLGVPVKPLNPSFGAGRPASVARIDEQACIGCTLCLQACPVDAIVGAAKLMHTVITRECTGCALCLPPCPVDCITLLERLPRPSREEQKAAAVLARTRFESRNIRLQRRQDEADRKRRQRSALTAHAGAEQKKRAAVEKAIARAAQRLRQHNS